MQKYRHKRIVKFSSVKGSDKIEKYSVCVCVYISSYDTCNRGRGRDSSVGIATRYGMDGPWIKSHWRGRGGARFSAPIQTGPGAYPASCTMGTGSFPGVRRPGRGADHPPPSKCRGEERVGLYLYSRSGPSWPVMGAPLPLPIIQRQCNTVTVLHTTV